MLLDPVVMAETDEVAPDPWELGFGTFRCPYTAGRWDVECLMVFSQPMEYVAHMQTHHLNW